MPPMTVPSPSVRKPAELVERHRRVEVDERLDKSGTTLAAPDLAAVEKLVVQLRDSGVKAVATPREACDNQDAIVTMLGDGKVVREALFGG